MKDIKEVLSHIGSRLRKSRKIQRITITEIASCLGVNHTTISRYETGKIDVPVSVLYKYGEACDKPPAWYLEDGDIYDELVEFLAGKGFPKNIPVSKWTLADDYRSEDIDDEVTELIRAYKRIADIPSADMSMIARMREDIIFHFELNKLVPMIPKKQRKKRTNKQ